MSIFESVGLSYYESKAMECLIRDKHTVQELLRKTNIPPGKIYTVLNQLVKKGVLQKNDERPTKYFVENASQVIGQLIEEKERSKETELTKLRNLATQMDSLKNLPTPFLDVGTSTEDNRRIQSRTFHEAQREICQIINMHHKPTSNRKSKGIWEQQIMDAIKRGIIFRTIYPLNTILPPTLQKLEQQSPKQFMVRRLDTDFTRCDIIDGKKVMLKLVQKDPLHFGGIIFLENNQLAKHLRQVFDILWQEASVQTRQI